MRAIRRRSEVAFVSLVATARRSREMGFVVRVIRPRSQKNCLKVLDRHQFQRHAAYGNISFRDMLLTQTTVSAPVKNAWSNPVQISPQPFFFFHKKTWSKSSEEFSTRLDHFMKNHKNSRVR